MSNLWPNEHEVSFMVVTGDFGSGKAQPLDAKVLTPSGWKLMGDLQIGDEVINPEGGTASIEAIFPQGNLPIVLVGTSDGGFTECSLDHLWNVATNKDRINQTSRVLTTQEIIDKGVIYTHKNGTQRYFALPFVSPPEFESSTQVIDPYILGILLGDGTLRDYGSILFTTADEFIAQEMSKYLPEDVELKHINGYNYRISLWDNKPSTNKGTNRSILVQWLHDVNLIGKHSWEKFIPQDYLLGSFQQRLSLLQGLMDTDGTAAKGISYSTTSKQLAYDVQNLVWSLGGRASLSTRHSNYTYKEEKKQGRTSYQIHISFSEGIEPFRLPRKLAKYQGSSRLVRRVISTIEPAGEKECQCIKLDSDNQLYITDDYIVTHNTSFALNVDPILKGKGETRTLYFDMENSGEEFAKNYELRRVDMPQVTADKYGPSWTNGDLYRLWWEIADGETQNYKFSTLVIDDWSPLQDGAAMVIKGRDNQDMWAKLKADFEQKFKVLMTRVDTIIVIVHLRNKRDNSKEKEPKGVDTLKKLSTLMIYLDRDPNRKLKINGKEYDSCPRYPYPSGYLLKSRLEVVSSEKDEFGDYKRKPLIPNRIPVCTPGALRKYMLNPSVEFGEDERLPDEGVPGMNLSEEDRKVEDQERDLQIAIAEGRSRLETALLEQGSYKTRGEIMKAVQSLGISYSLDMHDIIYNQLLDYKENQ